MNIYDFMAASPFVAAFIAFLICGTVFRMWIRFMRHLNIRAQGWPPAHCDADGDFKDVKQDDQ